MDGYGNVSNQEEMFGRRFRLISYLDPDVAVGVQGTADTGYSCGVVRLSSSADPASTIFTAYCNPKATSAAVMAYLSILWDRDQSYALGVSGNNAILKRYGGLQDAPMLQCYTTTSVWFILAFAEDPSTVLDCSESNTSQGNPILWFQKNGGNNQTWRATTKGSGL